MTRYFRILFIAICCFVVVESPVFSQSRDSSAYDANGDYIAENEAGFIFRPTLGLGIGAFTFKGDVGHYHKGFHPLVSRMGYNLLLSNPLTKEIDLNFYTIFGTISSSERSATRNLNFQSQIRTGGMVVSYDFGHFLPEKRFLEPYIFAGIESFEFLTKTDLYDRYGNRYYYWSDGSIRNMDENAPNAANSMIIHRDYHYETDVRESNLDGFGKYPERSWSVPLGIGFTMNLNMRWTLKLSTSMHFAFTDLVDGVSDESLNERKGDAKNDRFLYSSFSLSYDLQRLGGSKKPIPESFIDDEMQDYLARDTVDSDNDLVVDFIDDCAWTPPGVPVDERGCPLDKDKDLVADFRDDELPTPDGNIVNEKGVTITDDELYMRWLKYSDTTGKYVEFETIREDAYAQVSSGGRGGTKFVVVVANEKKSVSPEELKKYLSMRDFKTIKSNDTIYYVVGEYKTVEDALARKNELEQEGHKVEGIAKTTSGTDKNNNPETKINIVSGDKLPAHNNPASTNDETVVFRVQIGAFTKAVSPEVFKDVPGLLVVKGADGVTRYYSGAFPTFDKAAEHKVNLDMQGYSGAFVVAYKQGARQDLEKVGATLAEGAVPSDINIDEKTDITKAVVDPSLVKYRIEVGRFKNDIPTAVLDMFLDLGQVIPRRGENGDIVYLHGEFSSMAEASAALKKAKELGLKTSFIIGDFNGKIITAEEAQSLLRQ